MYPISTPLVYMRQQMQPGVTVNLAPQKNLAPLGQIY